MSDDIVYVIGAGLNRPLRRADLQIQAPMSGDFFQALLRSQEEWRDARIELLQPLFAFIERYWHRSLGSLRSEPLDLEEVFTFIAFQRDDARKRRDDQGASELGELLFLLTSVIANVLGPFENLGMGNVESAFLMHRLGDRLLKESPSVLTFNYDTILESAIERASGKRDEWALEPVTSNYRTPKKKLGYSQFTWNRILSYGFQFDEVQLDHGELVPIEDGDRFYSVPENELYDSKVLKLHGSLNWCTYSPDDRRPKRKGSVRKRAPLFLLQPDWDLAKRREHRGRFVDPVIITPVLNKQSSYESPPFRSIWRQAREALEGCRMLVVIGYSSPPTDFGFRRLLRESFQENVPDELIVVNPDSGVVARMKELVHYKKAVSYCTSLAEFLG